MGTQIRAVVITASDACARGLRPDESGEVLRQLLVDVGAVVVDSEILSDDPEPLIETLRRCAARSAIKLIITTGGTGLGPRDNTPEATRAVVERDVPGIAEAI